ncbi:nitrate reductase (NADH) [Emericellopsis cladophorae]|uniref:Nitrate reductase (NADH) n=1 Tax=Emericellopsis cladophorae TaxID=2686198 RepID=A0A9P9Y4C8_9HYPO|nr:nitrate reductase (NADH) [Emericellopsis cladophorae]KAI6783166.1 nitrate reductase (NADH) [Emericellopsis cladophorae]
MGYAYDGGGHEVQRVEVSVDDGKTWLYCLRRFPDAPIRHGNNITVRCFNVFKNTQPREPGWNIVGMMNNCWYVLRPGIVDDKDPKEATLVFWHPTEVGSGDEGWMKPSVESQIAEAKHKDDCWIMVDGKVYDATSVLEWHSGGAAAILGHAGQVHQETSDEFAGIHDDYDYQKLKECALGTVTDKAANFIKQNAEQAAKKATESGDAQSKIILEKHRWQPVRMIAMREVSKDTRTCRFQLPGNIKVLGLGTCQHVEIGFHLENRMLVRSYTPTKPLLSLQGIDESDKMWVANGSPEDGTERSSVDGEGMFDLTIKTYFPDQDQPGGAMSNILDCVPIGEEVEMKGSTGEIEYHGSGEFTIEGQRRDFTRVSLVLGGSGITPGYSLITRIWLTKGDKTQLRVVDANRTESDILLRDELVQFERDPQGQLQFTHVLSHTIDTWQGEKGYVNEEILQRCLFAPDESNVDFLCGPSRLIQKAALPALKRKLSSETTPSDGQCADLRS